MIRPLVRLANWGQLAAYGYIIPLLTYNTISPSKAHSLFYAKRPALAVLQALIQETQATHVFWNRLYDPVSLERDTVIKKP